MDKGTDARPRGLGSTTSHRAMDSDQEGPGAAIWALSPTDLTFLWHECRRCFYKKVALNQPRPRAPFPQVFGLIDSAMKDYYLGRRTERVVPGMPPGVIGAPNLWVKSAAIVPSGAASAAVIRGRIDALVYRDDGTTAVVDFKTARANDDLLGKYARQLHAYAFALEHPSVGPPNVVSALGLLSFTPEAFEGKAHSGALTGGLTWTEVPFDRQLFIASLKQVLDVLSQPEAPPTSLGCPWCPHADDADAAA